MYVKALQPYAQTVAGIDIETEHLAIAARQRARGRSCALAACEALPYPADQFDLVLSHEVLEHVHDDRLAAAEMVRVLKPGGRAVIFVPNRLYPFETHGHYWRGDYHFGNTPLINYLPDTLRNRLAPHVRAYTASGPAPPLRGPAGAHRPPYADLSRLRQHRRTAPTARQVAAPHHLSRWSRHR